MAKKKYRPGRPQGGLQRDRPDSGSRILSADAGRAAPKGDQDGVASAAQHDPKMMISAGVNLWGLNPKPHDFLIRIHYIWGGSNRPAGVESDHLLPLPHHHLGGKFGTLLGCLSHPIWAQGGSQRGANKKIPARKVELQID